VQTLFFVLNARSFFQERDLYDLLYKAVQSHNNYTREASVGRGFDRHFLGLRQLLREGETHELLEDPLFAQSQTFKLSTSGLAAGDRFFGTGFGAPEKDGYGINCKFCFYLASLRERQDHLVHTLITYVHPTDLAGADIIKFGVESKKSSKETSTHKFRLAIIEALREMRRICEAGKPNDKEPSSKL